MALPGPTLSHLTMLPLCAAPSLLHKPPSSLLRLTHLRAPHSPRLPLLALATLSFHTTPSFAIAAHGLLLPPVQAHSAIFMVLRTPLSLPLLLSELQFVRAPLLPRPCRLQLSQDSPPSTRAPSVPAVSAAAAFSSLCTFLFPCGPFSGRNRTFLHGSSRESRREQGSETAPRREKPERWSGAAGARGLWTPGGCGLWGGSRLREEEGVGIGSCGGGGGLEEPWQGAWDDLTDST